MIINYNDKLKTTAREHLNNAVTKLNSCKSVTITIPSDFEDAGKIDKALNLINSISLGSIQDGFESAVYGAELTDKNSEKNASGFDFGIIAGSNLSSHNELLKYANKQKDSDIISKIEKSQQDKSSVIGESDFIGRLLRKSNAAAIKRIDNHDLYHQAEKNKETEYRQMQKEMEANKTILSDILLSDATYFYWKEKIKYGVGLTRAQIEDGIMNLLVASIAHEDPDYWEHLRASGVSEQYIEKEKKISAEFREKYINPLLYERANNSFTKNYEMKNNPDFKYYKVIDFINKRNKTNYSEKLGKFMGDIAQTGRRSFTNNCSNCLFWASCRCANACFKERF